ncbi:hypothetical protein Prudu_022598 [Prunus dulcis]|uniref:Leucine-rich repeat-containing N-terminal plant-type domain-containing protein n=1 Tax=Prunus dulcis TaxID=3755 RepID=A0A4Y1S022_PRUDU|nr:hypothetical protein Prudu_022598 [Prunus dulcis]
MSMSSGCCLVVVSALGVESDINCLKSIKASLEDTLGYLNSSWDFNNNTEGFICNFLGVECWHPHETFGHGLKGQFPRRRKLYKLNRLDLSGNMLSGPLPHDIDKILTFTGQIPLQLSNCSYLIVLKLDNNKFSGTIPPELGQLSKIYTFSVANNQLSGQVPNFNNPSITVDSYANNPGLCGKPLEVCGSPAKKSSIVKLMLI